MPLLRENKGITSVEILDVLDRAGSGPYMPAREWDARFFPGVIKRKLKEHGIEKTYDPENPVNTDDGLADSFWKAGYETFLETGAFCLSTLRRIVFTEEEVKQILQESPTEWGSGGEREGKFVFRKRRPEDRYKPVAVFGALGIHIDEDIFIPALMSIAQYKEIDAFGPSCLPTVKGRKIKARTPYETYVGKYEGILYRTAVAAVGRPELPTWCVESAASEYGNLGGYGIKGAYRPTDYAVILAPTELKTSYDQLHRVVHDIYCVEGVAMGNHFSMIGGYAGGPEGAAVASIAAAIMQRSVHFLTVTGGLILNVWTMGNCDRQSIWASGVSQQAQNRNTHMLTYGLISCLYGCVTPELLYEIAALGMTDVVSGVSMEAGTRPTGCKYPNHFSGLENKWAAEITHMTAGMKRADANEIVKSLLPKYEEGLKYPKKGKSFRENTDLTTLQPSKEWADIYIKVKKELIDLGVPLVL